LVGVWGVGKKSNKILWRWEILKQLNLVGM